MDVNLFGLVAALIVVTVWHEMGHWFAARAVGIPVRRIYVGMGPVLWQRTLRRDTDLVLRALPLGMAIAVPGRRENDGSLRRPIDHDLLMAAGGPAGEFCADRSVGGGGVVVALARCVAGNPGRGRHSLRGAGAAKPAPRPGIGRRASAGAGRGPVGVGDDPDAGASIASLGSESSGSYLSSAVVFDGVAAFDGSRLDRLVRSS